MLPEVGPVGGSAELVVALAAAACPTGFTVEVEELEAGTLPNENAIGVEGVALMAGREGVKVGLQESVVSAVEKAKDELGLTSEALALPVVAELNTGKVGVEDEEESWAAVDVEEMPNVKAVLFVWSASFGDTGIFDGFSNKK